MWSIALLIIQIIVALIKLWVSLKDPKAAAEYTDKVNSIKVRMKARGVTTEDLNDLHSIRADIRRRFGK